MEWHCWIFLLLQFSVVAFRANVTASKDPNEKRLSFLQQSKCTYSYELAVHTARGSKSTESDGFQVHALVSTTPKVFSYCSFMSETPRFRVNRMTNGGGNTCLQSVRVKYCNFI